MNRRLDRYQMVIRTRNNGKESFLTPMSTTGLPEEEYGKSGLWCSSKDVQVIERGYTAAQKELEESNMNVRKLSDKVSEFRSDTAAAMALKQKEISGLIDQIAELKKNTSYNRANTDRVDIQARRIKALVGTKARLKRELSEAITFAQGTRERGIALAQSSETAARLFLEICRLYRMSVSGSSVEEIARTLRELVVNRFDNRTI